MTQNQNSVSVPFSAIINNYRKLFNECKQTPAEVQESAICISALEQYFEQKSKEKTTSTEDTDNDAIDSNSSVD